MRNISVLDYNIVMFIGKQRSVAVGKANSNSKLYSFALKMLIFILGGLQIHPNDFQP